MAPDWLLARPVAHRGLHDVTRDIVENTASAFEAAASRGYTIECDVQVSADGEAMVFHDDTLDRLIGASGRVDALPAAALKGLPMRSGTDRMITLGEMCDLVAGRVPMIVEVKAAFGGERRLERRVADVLAAYREPTAMMSFDPDATAWFRRHAPGIVRGVVQESVYDHPEWDHLDPATKRRLAWLLHLPATAPHFLSWSIQDVDRAVPRFARRVLRIPMLTWTIRTDADRAKAARFADQVTFEGFAA